MTVNEYHRKLIDSFLKDTCDVYDFDIVKGFNFITYEGDSGEGSSSKYLVKFSHSDEMRVICVSSFNTRFLSHHEMVEQLGIANDAIDTVMELMKYV